MKKLFSFLLGGLLLIGGATVGLQSANAAVRHDKNWRRHHRHHHRRYHKNHLSY